jgi:thiol-disulfide isomerase/thioredoxin
MRFSIISLRCIVILFFLCFRFSSLAAQEGESGTILPFPKNKPVQKAIEIGDQVPDFVFDKLLNYSTTKAKLSDFKGKLVLLDFWSTTCTSCLANFPKMEYLQEKFKDKIQIVLVNTILTRDDATKILSFFERRRNPRGEKYKLLVSIEDRITDGMFPHRSLPHYVWIGPDRILRAITTSAYVTDTNIKSLLENQYFELPIKREIDADLPLFMSDEIKNLNMLQRSLFVKGKIDGLPSGSRWKINNKKVNGIMISNRSMLEMYKEIAKYLIPGLSDHKIILSVKDSSLISFDSSKRNYYDDWAKKNAYTYELIVPIEQATNLYQYAFDDLNRYSDYKGEVETRLMPCLALIEIGKEKKFVAKNGEKIKSITSEKMSLHNVNIMTLINELTDSFSEKIILNETGYNGKIDIEIKLPINGLDDLRRKLNLFNLDVVPVDREQEILFISDKNETQSKPDLEKKKTVQAGFR